MSRRVTEFKDYPQEYILVDAKKLLQYETAKVSESEYTSIHVRNISWYVKSDTHRRGQKDPLTLTAWNIGIDKRNILAGTIHIFENSEIWKKAKVHTRSVYTSTKNMENKIAFNKFKAGHIDDPEFKDKFVAFVNGEFQSVGDRKETLVESMYDRFGNVPMYVSVISNCKRVVRLRTPRFKRIEV